MVIQKILETLPTLQTAVEEKEGYAKLLQGSACVLVHE